jgi:hypothetical protein
LSREKTGKQRRFAFLAVLILIPICLCSCASRSAVNKKQLFVYLTNRAQYILLPPGGIEKPMDMAQYISIAYGGQDFYFNAWVQADETGMEMTLFNELGTAMGELRYSEGFINLSSPAFPDSLKPEYIVADFQLCFYDPLMLREALKNCGLAFEADETSRRVMEGKNIIINIEKNQNIIQIKNHLRGYVYTLEGDF